MNKARQTVLEFRSRIVAEKFPRFGNVGTGQRHVARLFRQPVDLCFFAERLFNRGDQVFELNRLALAQIENVKHRAIVFKSGHCPLDDVVDVSVVAARRAVAEPIDQFGDGTTRRDYTYIDDIIQGTMAAFKYDGPMFDVFNLGESETIQLKDLIAAIEKALGKKAKINRLPEQPGDMSLTCADISKARKLLGYNPRTKFQDGLPRFVHWFLKSRAAK